MSSAPPTYTYGAGAATLSVVFSWHALFGSMVASCMLKPVGWKSIVYVKKTNTAAV
jgi:hypothetical protein